MKIHHLILPHFELALNSLPGETKEIPAKPHPLLIAYLLQNAGEKGPHLLISSQKALLLEIRSALLFFEPEQKLFFFEEKTLEPEGTLKISRQGDMQKLRILTQAQQATLADIFMIQPQGLLEPCPSPFALKKQYIPLQKGHNLPPDFPALLKKTGYENRDRVEQIGEFSMRGAILDIFCPLNGPLRLDLIGHEVDQIRFFNVQTQKSFQEIKSTNIAPAKENCITNKHTSYHFLDYLPSPLLWFLDDPKLWQNSQPAQIKQKARKVIFTSSSSIKPAITNSFPLTENFFKNPHWPIEIKKQREKGMLVFIFAGKEKSQTHIQSLLEKEGIEVKQEKSFFEMNIAQERNVKLLHLIQSINLESLVWTEKNWLFLKADSFARFFLSKPKPFFQENKQAGHFSFADIQPGDLMVHRNYGIGRFKGLKLFNFGVGKTEFLIMEYQNKEKLYVPVYTLHQVQKYMTAITKDEEKLLDKLGSSKWLNTKERVKNKIKNMSLELMNLYHKRANLKRKNFLK